MSQFDMYESDNLSENLSENLSDLIAPISSNRSSQSGLPPSTNAKTREILAKTAKNIDSSAMTPEESTEDSSWETVNFPGAMSVDDLELEQEEVTPVEPEAPNLLPLDYYKLTIAQIIEAQKLVTKGEEPSASGEPELCEEIEHLENLLSQYQRFVEDQQLNAEAQQAQLDEKTRALQAAQAQIKHLTEELAVCQEKIQDQLYSIADLSKKWQQSQERLAQLERECATTVQLYHQQVHLNLQAANTCRELRDRLNRQQRQSLQFKAALEKSLENQQSARQKELEGVTVTDSRDYSLNLEEDFSGEIASDRTEEPIAVSPWGVVPKSVPIQPWYTTSSKTSVFELEEKLERMTETPELPPSASCSPGSAPAADRLQSANSLSLPMVSPRPETKETQNQILNWPEEDNLIQTIRDMVSPAANGSLPPGSVSEGHESADLPISAQGTDLANSHEALATTLASTSVVVGSTYRTEFQPNSGDNSANSHSDLPELLGLAEPIKPMNPMNSPGGEPTQNWPAPVVYPERSAKKRRSLAAVELPRFPTK
ncbi:MULTISPECIES: hypothetical protein [Planktothricoides]|uniref:Uncharacterized protein n=2 Tax=Planktothricoides raciborskii TaxID=132608 RepID=A0AAU8J6I0_9CYAN|nr:MULTISPECIES: hypothetical protein [Planktothricoides]MBD2545517.1 hypothetical protein [Planktothricoides raciborskii FACHB-1370]MBD2583421.1 hypothetical protein [Planktothricoides raciborskii FACHB-1261]